MKSKMERLEQLLDEADAERALDEVSAMSKEQLEKELAEAGVDMKEKDARMAAFLAKHGVKVPNPAKPPKVVSLDAQRRKRFGFTPAWMAAAAVAAIAAGSIGVTVAMRDDGGDVPVAHPLCTPVSESGMTLDGTLEKRGDAFVLHLDLALCDGAGEVKLVAPDGVDLAPLVGRALHVEGRPRGVDARTILVEHATATDG